MIGLRAQGDINDTKFVEYFKIVQSFAEKEDSVFFLDCGEARDGTIGDISVEDLGGWLIPKDKADEFNELFLSWKDDDIMKMWDSRYCFAEWWEEEGKIQVDFETYRMHECDDDMDEIMRICAKYTREELEMMCQRRLEKAKKRSAVSLYYFFLYV